MAEGESVALHLCLPKSGRERKRERERERESPMGVSPRFLTGVTLGIVILDAICRGMRACVRVHPVSHAVHKTLFAAGGRAGYASAYVG